MERTIRNYGQRTPLCQDPCHLIIRRTATPPGAFRLEFSLVYLVHGNGRNAYRTESDTLRMKYFLWINGKQNGPYEPEQIREMLGRGSIVAVTLGRPEDSTGEWNPISSFTGVTEPVRSSEPTSTPLRAPAAAPTFSLPPIKASGVAFALGTIAILEFVGATIAGLVVGSANAPVGWLVFVSGVISGLILLGLVRIIEHLCESSQRLQRIEMLIQKAHDDKNAA